MSKVDRFSVNPTVTISRSKFVRPSQHKTSFKLGEIIPIYFDEVLPDDTRRIDFASLIRMSNPIAPIMDNIFVDYYAFFVPARLTWEHWKEFMGENTSSAGIYAGSEYKVPQVSVKGLNVGTLGDYFGLPVGVGAGSLGTLTVSALPIRGLRLIYNRWFRDQNLIAPVPVNLGDSSNSYDSYNVSPFKAAKISDYFTRALPYAQKGAPVSIPLGTTAPVTFYATDDAGSTEMIIDGPAGAGSALAGVIDEDDDSVVRTGGVSGSALNDPLSPGSVASITATADLSTATAATINQLRFAFQYQKMLEKDAMYGTRYWEILHAHFGVIAPDASLQDPEMLGHHRTYINIQQVIQTTGIDQATPSQNELGQVAGNSVTGDKANIISKSFTEHGFIYIFAVARHDQTYGQGINRMWTRSSRTDYYWPVFANLGAQKVLNKELYAQANTNDDNVFGYQEAWAEYRYKPSIVSGLLNPSVANSLGFWTLANNFGSLPTLSQSFIEQDRNALGRALSTSTTGPDFIADFAFKDIAVRALPMYSVPGLIDHH